MRKKVFIGIDVSKSKLDMSFLTIEDIGSAQHFIVENNLKGFQKMQNELSKLGYDTDSMLFCFENTGVYSYPPL